MRRTACLALLVTGGCGMLHETPKPVELEAPRIADLTEAADPTEEVAAPAMSAQRVAEWYERALDEDLPSEARRAALERLAALRLVAAEDAIAAEQPFDGEAIVQAVDQARQADPANPDLAYLEAHALAMTGSEQRSFEVLDEVAELGDAEPVAREARFRLAEAAFSAGRWQAAARGFAAVADASTELGLHATYMHGWARFKAGQPDKALEAFLDVLARLAERGELPPSMQELRGDVLRVLVFTLADLDGARTLAAAMARRGRPDWQVAIYEHLVSTRLEQARILDASRALDVFVAENPLHAAAPRLALWRIDVLREAGLASAQELEALRARYVDRFGAGSEFVAKNGPLQGDERKALVGFVARLATAAHVRAQESNEPTAWLDAAHWDEIRVANSPNDADVPAWLMLAGEAYEQAGDLSRAAATYDTLVARHAQAAQAPDAAYALIDLYRRLQSSALRGAQRRFIEAYADDVRAPAVAVALAKNLYDGGELLASADLIDRALARWNLAENERTARELAAAARLELGDVRRAREGYRVLLANFGDDAHAADYRARLLASTHRLAELDLESGNEDEAMVLFASMLEIDPEADITVADQFRRAAIFEQGGNLGETTRLLGWIRQRYPEAAAEQDVDARLADLYERAKQPAEAAREYAHIAETERYADDVRRLALFRAAELAHEAGDDGLAAQRFETYLSRWPKPFDYYAEALAERIELARAGQGQLEPWLEKELDWVEALGDDAPGVARERAARAAMALAEPLAQRYYAVKLGTDLAHSLASKRDAMTAAFDAYQRALALGVAEVTTDAGYRAAALFEDFAAELLASPRPDLDARALEEYELLLEEQAFPFEERAIELHARNVHLIPTVGLDDGTRASLESLARLSPARWARKEMTIGFATTLY